MSLTFKMKVNRVARVAKWESHDVAQEEVHLGAVTGQGNEDWAAATPQAQFTATIGNPEAFGQLVTGKNYIVTVTEAPAN